MHLNTQSQAWSDTALRRAARVCLLLENDARRAWVSVCGGARSCVTTRVGKKSWKTDNDLVKFQKKKKKSSENKLRAKRDKRT